VIDTRAELLLKKRSNKNIKTYLIKQERVNVQGSVISLTFFIALIILLGLLMFSVVLLNFQIAQNQLIIDDIKNEINYQYEIKERSSFKISQLQSPKRIYEEAIVNLGMTDPDEINYIKIDTYQVANKENTLEETQIKPTEQESIFSSKFMEDVYKTILTLLFP